MFRSSEAAARARIADLERQIGELKEQASDQAEAADEQVKELEAELERLRQAKAPRSRARWAVFAVIAAAIVGGIIMVAVGRRVPDNDLDAKCRARDVAACVDLGYQLKATDPIGAERAFRSACDLESPAGCTEIGWIAMARGDFATAEPLFQKACDRDYARACVNLGLILGKRKDPKAKEYARKACDLDDALGCSNLAGIADDEGNLAKAIELGRKSCDKGSPFGCADLSWYLLKDKKAKEALQQATRATQINPELPKVQMSVGHAVLIDGDVEEAVRRYRRTIELEEKPGGSERTFSDKPWGAIIRQNLEHLKTVYPDRAKDIDSVLARRKEWAP